MTDTDRLEILEKAILQRERQMFGLCCIIRELRKSPFESINRNLNGICDISDEGLRALGIKFVNEAREIKNQAG